MRRMRASCLSPMRESTHVSLSPMSARRYELNIGSPSPCSSIVGRATMVVTPTVAARHMRRRGARHVQLCHSNRSRRPREEHLSLRLRPHDRRGGPGQVRLRPGVGRRVGPGVRVAQGGVRERPDRLPPLPRPEGARRRLRRGRRLQDAPARGRPGPQERPARRRVAGQAPRLPQRRRGVGARRPHRGRPGPLPRARGRPRRPAARQAAHVQVPAQARPGGRRDDAGRAPQVELDRGVLEVGEVDRVRRGRRRGRLRALHGVSVNLFFTSFAKQARRSRKGGFTGCANVFSPIPVTA